MLCEQKVRYIRKRSALAIVARYRKLGIYRRAYKCPHCHCWHLTSQIRKLVNTPPPP